MRPKGKSIFDDVTARDIREISDRLPETPPKPHTNRGPDNLMR
jgi:hypothetical protein